MIYRILANLWSVLIRCIKIEFVKSVVTSLSIGKYASIIALKRIFQHIRPQMMENHLLI